MHRSRPTEGKYREAMGVLPSLQGMDASGIGHAFIHNLVNAPGRLFNRETRRVGDAFLDGAARGSEVYPELAPQKVVGIKVAKHQVGVGNSRFASSIPVADRAWIS